jgi:hypothetical protein
LLAGLEQVTGKAAVDEWLGGVEAGGSA